MSDQQPNPRRKLIVAVIAIFIVLSGVVYAVGNSNGDNKADKTAKTGQEQETEQQDETKKEDTSEVAGAATDTPAPAETPAPAPVTPPRKKPAVKTATAPVTPAPAPQTTQPATPPANEPPVVPPQEEEEEPETPVESCFAPGADVTFVPVGGNSGTITFTTSSDVLWWSYGESLDTSDAGTNVKPGFPVYIVVESPYDVMTPSSSITLHIHARDTAAPGEYCPADEIEQLGLVAVDPTTLETLFRISFDVTVTEAPVAL